MVLRSPAEALGADAPVVREVILEVTQTRHARAVEGHLASGSRYSIGFGSQWLDLRVEVVEAFASRGYQSQKVSPGGYRLPVVNGCLLYVWRVPSAHDDVTNFASSATRKNCFSVQPPAPMLFGPGSGDEADLVVASENADEVGNDRLVHALGGPLPVVLAMVRSSPRQLQLIEWALAELEDSGNVKLLGREPIWKPEEDTESVASVVESFDRGTPVEPVVELREQEGVGLDA